MLDALLAARARVSEIDAKIRALELSPSTLHAERTLAQAPLDSYASPILTLPTEVTCEIFQHFMPTYPACPPISGALSPVTLTHICRAWREIALATPDLWRRIQVDCALAEQAEAWIARSGSRGLCIESRGCLRRRHLPVLVAVIPHRARWEYLKLHFHPLTSLSRIPIIDGPMPLLHHLDISFSQTVPTNLFTFLDAPRLRTVASNYIAAAKISVHWSQITAVTLRAMWLVECVPVLTQASRLVHCRLSVAFGAARGPFPEFRLPALQTLILRDEDHRDIEGFMDAVTFVTPALHTLGLPARWLGPVPANKLRVFISKAGCNLARLYIGGVHEKKEIWKEPEAFRQEFPDITDISFPNDNEDEWLF
ncbi:hypothetical protein C8R46DRAFT_1309387 [Mycena filopes]|nr:hypothetical protein C8R46DRAFT_1309387 [Mycena filopes]